MRLVAVRPARRLGVALLLALTVGYGLFAPPVRGEDPNGVEKAKSLSRAFRAAAKKVVPTVVKIKTSIKSRVIDENERGPAGNPFKGTPFEDFFGDQQPGMRGPLRTPRREGLGSGVIIDSSGIILTNNHVVDGADEVLVELSDGRQFKADNVKIDQQSDLAVLRIKANQPLPAATLGDSEALDIGDWVLAIGNPFDLDLTVSAGIISSKGRVLPSSKRASYLQTDAAINPGNSGGPLVNLDGEIVGINTAIASNTGSYEGIGFAIPSNLAKWVSKQLIEKGVVERAYLGVAIAEVNGLQAKQLGLERARGVLVSEVYPNTPAAAAGLREADVIVGFAGRAVANPRELQEIVERSPMNSKQQISIVRDGKPQTLTITVQSLPKDFGMAGAIPRRPSGGAERSGTFAANELGLEVDNPSEAVAKRLGAQSGVGVVIVGVDANGVAEEAGLREGMMILRVGKTQIRSVADFKAALKKESLKEGVMLLVRTAEGNRFVVLQGD